MLFMFTQSSFKQFKQKKVVILNSFFSDKLVSHGYSGVERYYKKVIH